MPRLLLSDYVQGISDLRFEFCNIFTGKYRIRCITSASDAVVAVDLDDDLGLDGQPGATPVGVRLSIKRSDFYLHAFEPAGGKAITLDSMKLTNYAKMQQPVVISLNSVRTAIRTLRSWDSTVKPGKQLQDATFDAKVAMTGSEAVFTVCVFVSEAMRFSSVCNDMALLLAQPALGEAPTRSLAVDDKLLGKLQSWSDASESYFNLLYVEEGLKQLADPKTRPQPPALPGTPPPLLTPLPPATELPPPTSPLAEQLMKDIVVVKLPRKVMQTPPVWHAWALKKFPSLWT